MVRGKCASQSANRRAAESQARCKALELELRVERETHKAELDKLRGELTALRADMLHKAGQMAKRAVEKERREAEENRRRRGLSDEIAQMLMNSRDRFVMNACRYLSMTRGMKPLDALPLVITWATDKDFYGYGMKPVDYVVELGVRPDGWVAHQLRTIQRSRLKTKVEGKQTKACREAGAPEALALDNVEEREEQNPGAFEIHPKYRKSWYPPVRHTRYVPVGDKEDGAEEAPA